MLTFQIDSQTAQEKSKYEKFVADSKAKIVNINTELAKWEAMMPVEEMNREEALNAGLTQLVVDTRPGAQPQFWPHDEDFNEWQEYMRKLKENPDSDGH